jgi:hypothetical protein
MVVVTALLAAPQPVCSLPLQTFTPTPPHHHTTNPIKLSRTSSKPLRNTVP